MKTDAVRRPNDTSTSDGHGVVDPIWIYTDSLIVYRIVDTIIRDTIVLTYDYSSTIYLDDSTSNVIIVKSDTSGTARFTGNDFAPRIHSIYPNPNSDYIDLQVDGMGSAATVTIYSQMGVQLSETTVGSSEKLSRVSTSGLAPGMYMAVIKTAKGRTSKNFIVNR
ncbi:MAG: T9SS type A sorting domain-containing protein [Ignavibacteria bacterium]|nr:T9SS type A sorting domain-containing protein [Ignavibacteria bacterium]